MFDSNDVEDFINSGGVAEIQSELKKELVTPLVAPLNPVEPSPSTRVDLDTPPDPFLGLDIRDPVELLILLDPDIASGRVKLHKWQVQILMDFAAGGQTDTFPIQQLVRACNGSGKDKYIVAPCVVWLCMRFKNARGVVTSASGQQLDAQTGKYIDQLCEAANRHFSAMFGAPIWKVNYRYYECLATGSPIDLFATDEPKKAEGYHPLSPGAKMAIIVSEDKSVPDDINIALNKCTGYTHRLHVSTPGPQMGHFYDYCTRGVPRDGIKTVKDVRETDWIHYHVTSYMCSHLSLNYIEQMKMDLPGGEQGVAFQSQVMAEFGSADQMVVIPSLYVWKASNGAKFGHLVKPHNDAGVDLSDGGAETVLVIRNGNKQTRVIAFKFDNTEDTVAFLHEKFIEFELNNPNSRINADCGGIGKPILDRLKGMGWSNIYYIDNRNTPRKPRVYKNRAAELWFEFRKLLERNEIWLLNDTRTKQQLATRFYTITPDNKHQLESKLQARSKGHPSPDRADATILCFWDYESVFKPVELAKPFENPRLEKKIVPKLTLREYANRAAPSPYMAKLSKRFNFSSIKGLLEEHKTKDPTKL